MECDETEPLHCPRGRSACLIGLYDIDQICTRLIPVACELPDGLSGFVENCGCEPLLGVDRAGIGYRTVLERPPQSLRDVLATALGGCNGSNKGMFVELCDLGLSP